MPALLLMLVFVVLYARFVAQPGTYPGLRWDVVSTLFDSANWRFIVDGQSYAAQTGPVTPLLHMWSLAIEEQFYIVWPVVVLCIVALWRHARTRALHALLGLSVLGAGASALDMALRFRAGADPDALYFGTDTHAQCLLVGTALAAGVALWWRRGGDPATLSAPARRIVGGAGVLGVGVCAWAWSQLQYGQALVFRGGFLVVALAVAAVVGAVVLRPAGVVGRALSPAPLRFLGRISYGMYLWHFPLDIAITGARTGTTGVPLFVLRSAATVAVSALSFYALERPVRSGAFPAFTRARLAIPLAAAGAAALVAVAALPSAAAGASLPSDVTSTTAAAGSVALAPALAHAPVRVMVVGDSVALSLGVGLEAEEAADHVHIDDLGILGCGVAMGTTVWTDVDGELQSATVVPPCQSDPSTGVPWTAAWTSWLHEVRPNVVVLLAGRWEVVDRLYKGRRSDILQPAFARYVRAMLERAVAIGTSTGAHMVLMTAPCFSSGEQPDGSVFPEDDPARVKAYNRLVEAVGAAHRATVTVEDLYAMACPGGRFTPALDGVTLRSPDGIHFDMDPGTGGAVLAPLLLPQWETLGHEQEAAGGHVDTGLLPTAVSPQ